LQLGEGQHGAFGEGGLCKVMESINGGELFTHLRRARKFSDEQSKFYALQARKWERVFSVPRGCFEKTSRVPFN